MGTDRHTDWHWHLFVISDRTVCVGGGGVCAKGVSDTNKEILF